MKKPYKAVFIIPRGATRNLTDAGWEFSTPQRLPLEILFALNRTFHLDKKETYLGMEVYEGKGIKLTAVFDEAGLVENIYIQLSLRTFDEVERALSSVVGPMAEIFSPK